MGPPPFNSLHQVRASLFRRDDPFTFFRTGLRVSFTAAPEMSLVSTARNLLSEAGLSDPNELKSRLGLPRGTWFFYPTCPESEGRGGVVLPPLPPLQAALILGLCGVSLYAPERPVVWSEGRLSRSLTLIQPETFYDDEP